MMSFVLDEISSVVSNIAQQVTKMDDTVNALRTTFDPLQDTWTGEGANAFKSEFATRVIPEIMALIASIGGMNFNLQGCADMMMEADQQGTSTVGNLEGIIEAIF